MNWLHVLPNQTCTHQLLFCLVRFFLELHHIILLQIKFIQSSLCDLQMVFCVLEHKHYWMSRISNFVNIFVYIYLLTFLLVGFQSDRSSSGIQTAFSLSPCSAPPHPNATTPTALLSRGPKRNVFFCFGGSTESRTLLTSAADVRPSVTKHSISSNPEPLQGSTSKQEERWWRWWSSLFSITEITAYSSCRGVIMGESYSIKDTEHVDHSNPFHFKRLCLSGSWKSQL